MTHEEKTASELLESPTEEGKAVPAGKKVLNGFWLVGKWILIILFFPLSLIFVAYFRQKRKY